MADWQNCAQYWHSNYHLKMLNGVILISGNGSNLQSMIDNALNIRLNIRCVISNNPNAYGLERAQKSRIPTRVINHRDFLKREDFDALLTKTIDEYRPEIVILAGFMRILSTQITQKYLGKMFNIHPSLLPKFPGLNTHQRAIEAGEKIHGASVHFVTETLDGGAIIAQCVVEIKQNDTAQSLAKRVLIEEHKLYPRVIQWFSQNRLKLSDGNVILDGEKQ